MAEYVEIEKAVNIASVNYGLNHNQAHGFRNDLKRNSESIHVRCYDDCYWVRQDWGDEVTPPSTECGKDVKAFDQLNIDPCYGERDEEECPDCPFYVNYERLLQMESEYHDGEPVPDMNDATRRAISMVAAERRRQIEEWGLSGTLYLFELMSILGEEFGELCQAVNETLFNNPKHPERGGEEAIIREAAQTAAVAVQIIEVVNMNKRAEDGA